MTSRDLCYWLQGFFEMRDTTGAGLTEAQVHALRQHLALVFVHEIDPSAGPPEHQAALNAIHSPDCAPVSNATTTSTRPQIGGVGPGGILYRC